MAWNYRRRIKIIPGVHLNFSKNGISTSIGVKGANITFRKSGAYLNTSIPGLGVYNRQKLSGSNSNPVPENTYLQMTDVENSIFSANVQEITSQDMQGIKEAIILAHQQRIELKDDLLKVKAQLLGTKIKLITCYILLYGIIKKSISENIKDDINSQKGAITQLIEQIDNCFVNLDIDFEIDIEKKYIKLVETFKNLCGSNKIWDVISSYYQDTKITRSSAGKIVKKTKVKFSTKSLPDIKSKFEALYFQNANGTDLYFYPNFIVMQAAKNNFAIIGINEIEFFQSYVTFTETGLIPLDAEIIDKTWAKVNINGTPDRRFKGNYQIPVAKYGEIKLRTKTGLNKEYEFSNYKLTEEFGKAFRDYQITIKNLSNDDNYIENISTANKNSTIIDEIKLDKPKTEIENGITLMDKNTLDTEASIVYELGKATGQITRLSGVSGSSDIKLFLALDDWKNITLNLLPFLSVVFKVDEKYNFLTITSSSKDVSPLKKGDSFLITFDDSTYIEKKFAVGRVLSGKLVINSIILSDIELSNLGQKKIKAIQLKSTIPIPYDFTEKPYNQYSNSSEGKKLFQIMAQRIMGIKSEILKRNELLQKEK